MAATTIREYFDIPAKTKTWSFALMAIGAITLIIGLLTKGISSDEHERAIFWGTLMYNSMFFTMVSNSCMFFICASTLSMASWYTTFRRVPEALSAMVKIFGPITFFILIYVVVIDKNHDIYHWLSPDAKNDKVLSGKLGFLSPTFFLIWSILTLGLWIVLGMRIRSISNESDNGPMDQETGKSFIWRNTVTAALFIVWFGLTVGSTLPWLWLMSLDAHWYSTMYSWYTFASTFVSGVALITLWVIYLKNKGYLEYTNEEHLHDLGKFIFAFSIFWTYLWFAQYMLIWYGNIPEETIYFKHRVQGPYKGIFFLNLIINFVCPILLLMKKGPKRNYTFMTFMAMLILFGHWIDFYQMVMGSVRKEDGNLSWFDFGIAALFIGLMIFYVTKALAKRPLVPKNNPFLKESIIHHT